MKGARGLFCIARADIVEHSRLGRGLSPVGRQNHAPREKIVLRKRIHDTYNDYCALTQVANDGAENESIE
jgi:hypothetical protein